MDTVISNTQVMLTEAPGPRHIIAWHVGDAVVSVRTSCGRTQTPP